MGHIGTGMDYPTEGCECGDCEYARWFDSLDEEGRRRELELMWAYEPNED